MSCWTLCQFHYLHFTPPSPFSLFSFFFLFPFLFAHLIVLFYSYLNDSISHHQYNPFSFILPMSPLVHTLAPHPYCM